MRARKFVLIAVVAVVAILAARALGLWVGGQFLSPPTTQPAPLPALVFAEEDLTFGPIPESEPVERTLRLTNHSAEPITVERFDTSCSCLGVEPAGNLTLPAGETAQVIARGHGDRGSNREYLLRTLDGLRQAGIADAALENLVQHLPPG